MYPPWVDWLDTYSVLRVGFEHQRYRIVAVNPGYDLLHHKARTKALIQGLTDIHGLRPYT